VFRSTDNGANWTAVNNGLTNTNPSVIVSLDGEYVGTSGGVFRTFDYGDTWEDFNDGLTTLDVRALASPGPHQYLFAGTAGGGVFRILYDVSVESEFSVPSECTLSQNFPNPFNPKSEIGIRIATAGHVSLKVHDLLGREIATLLNERLSPGTYTREFDATGLPSGVYFYTLRANDFVATRKMIYLR
jgi:hypothetical protein